MFPLIITSVDEILFEGEAQSVTLPGSEGELTILKNHIPLITTLRKGTITVRGAEQKNFPVEKGILEVSKTGATVLI